MMLLLGSRREILKFVKLVVLTEVHVGCADVADVTAVADVQ
jgi:hypothetical protein